jgi:hypothetical protein
LSELVGGLSGSEFNLKNMFNVPDNLKGFLNSFSYSNENYG